ncbi:VOC family protein [Geomesophilobacter sediminis]|uniref:VOC family protein n=1 Tax=Geomesophilobacter sediminis TaxID=2798584 RepID=A0A8J7M1Z1_9BACT|nr:VOC family protein [Geomesophilobacter sediminis]MBJ6727063.1 VOC family protein [Geomesophilobacter sediminis]
MNGSQLLTIQLVVEDLDATEAFYRGILELPVERALTAVGAPEHLVMTVEGVQVIFVEEDAVEMEHPILVPRLESFPKGVGMTLHLTVRDLDFVHGEILEEDLEILYPPKLNPYGALELWCFDPDGYLVVLQEPRRRAPVP